MWEFFNLWSFIIQFINICIIIYLLNRFLFKPYLKYLDLEDKKRQDLEKAHEDLEVIKEKATNEAKNLIEEAKEEAKFIKKQWRELTKQEAEVILNHAKLEAVRIKTKWLEDVENERSILYNEIKEKILNIALKLNEQLFIDSKPNIDFIKKSLEKEVIEKN